MAPQPVRALLLERAQNDLAQALVRLARDYDLSVLELSGLLIRELADLNQIGLEQEAELEAESAPKESLP
jgi:hypothetical protein